MLNIGKNLVSPNDILQSVKIESVHKATINANGEVATLIRRLQSIRMIDENQYRKMKTKLPYLVCARFHPNIRRKENFLYTDSFILDLDHLQAYDIDIQSLSEKLKKDERVVFMFTSPSGDGLKILFKLNERISDIEYYKIFYRTFAIKFSEQYGLSGIVDLRTHDVSRCCFVSYDPNAYLNLNAEKIDIQSYVLSQDGQDKAKQENIIKEAEKDIVKEHKELGIATGKKESTLSDEILNQIKRKVGVRVKKKKIEKEYIQPKELDMILPEIMQELAAIDVEVEKSNPISYGRQLRIKAQHLWAEINIFYGKGGVNIVKTTKTGSNKELCETVSAYLRDKFQNKIIH